MNILIKFVFAHYLSYYNEGGGFILYHLKDFIIIVSICSFFFIGILVYNFVTAPTYSQPNFYSIDTSSNPSSNLDTGSDTLDDIGLETDIVEAEIEIVDVFININTATAQELTNLNGIGAVTAEAIVEYRLTNGDFALIEDIMNVSGIGEAKFENIKDFIFV